MAHQAAVSPPLIDLRTIQRSHLEPLNYNNRCVKSWGEVEAFREIYQN
jgi:hypothetical protein